MALKRRRQNMLGWIFVIFVTAVVSFVMHIVGWANSFAYGLFFTIIWDILLLLVALGLLTRMLMLNRTGEKEALYKRVADLEEKLKGMEKK
jgi:hypothetical protein